MKTNVLATVALAAVAAIGGARQAGANVFSDKFDARIVAEQGSAPSLGAASRPMGATSYVAFDGGYIEAGDSVAGDTPPSPEQVRTCVHDVLAEQGFSLSKGTPAVVLTYHWGVIRPDHIQVRPPYAVKPNLLARIELVGTRKQAEEVENHLVAAKRGGGLNDEAAAPALLVGPEETVLEAARQPRYFVIVSAYDYAALRKRQALLLWRVKASARDVSGPMDSVLPSLLAAASRYFGKDLPDALDIDVEPYALQSRPDSTAAEIRAAQESSSLNRAFMDELMRVEREKFSGLSDDDSA